MTAEKATTRAGRNPVLVLEKVNLILTYLADVYEAGPSEVAESVGLNKSTAFRLLSSLTHIGLVDRDADTGMYRLGLRLMSLGSLVERRLDLRSVVLPHLQQLAVDTGQTAFLCVKQGFGATCLARVPGAHVEVLDLHPGESLPLHMGATGRVILASLPDEEIEHYLRTARLERRTENTLYRPEDVRRDIRQTREQGYAFSDEDVTLGIAAIGAPLLKKGSVVGAISVSGLATAFKGERLQSIREHLLETCYKISTELLGTSVDHRGRNGRAN